MLRRARLAALDRFLPRLVPLALLVLLNGCSTLGYYAQLADGQWQLLRARQPVTQVIADPTTSPALRQRLEHSQAARRFASAHLHLPDNRSYRLYADIQRDSVVWNVFATAEFSLDPVTHCFPIAGCVAYRGYYAPGAARGAAAVQRQQGLDVYVSGVEAYSTLGWFDDPIISSMMTWGDERLATLIFHELAHQNFYLKNDTQFNESYASFVEQEGTRQWRAARGLAPDPLDAGRQLAQFTALVLQTRERLQHLYAQPLPVAAMRAAKAAEFDGLRQRYAELKAREWNGQGRFDRWVYSPLNNAKLLPFGLYDRYVPAFARLFQQAGGDWPAFYQQVRHLGALPAQEREAALQRLL
jgi:predicted aminopeptidase